ncbi:transposase [Anaerolineales bacterium HSG25]|nr:transposase [Anaerolineales bacterium HSG25]
MTKKTYHHSPTHLFIDDTPYFITAAIYEKRPLLQSPTIKTMLLERIKHSFNQHQWELHHWVILDNHYHILGQSRRGRVLSVMMKSIHSFMAYHIKEATQASSPIWWNYWDYCPRDEQDYTIRLNYLLNNPVKHGYVTNLNDYPFSSFFQAVDEHGVTHLRQQFREYPEYRTLVLREAYNDDF